MRLACEAAALEIAGLPKLKYKRRSFEFQTLRPACHCCGLNDDFGLEFSVSSERPH